ncbi:MAG TPA: DUF4352 domain-containing protein [Symbiobacteriaceae bacterium]|nr:DUF4352 domain-containing protein [Symbiobacteriaceae bacterium]
MKITGRITLLLSLMMFALTACTSGTPTASSDKPAAEAEKKADAAATEKPKEEPAKTDAIPTVKLADTVTQDPYSFKVNSVKVASEHNQFKTDKQFVIVEIITSNSGISNGAIFSNSFALKDGKGTEWQHYDLGGFNYQGWIMPSKYLQGKVLFETPPGVTGLRLIVNGKNAIDLGL